MPHLSIVSPVYGAEKIIHVLVERIEKAISTINDDYEIILVEDGGPDASWTVIEKISEKKSQSNRYKTKQEFWAALCNYSRIGSFKG